MTNGERDREGSLLALALLALAAGALAGLVGAIFRLCLAQADRLRDVLIAQAHSWGAIGFLFVLAACAAATALAAWLVRRYAPHASGSGIPHVEAVLRGELPQAPFGLIPVKFFGDLGRNFYALDAATGQKLWGQKIGGAIGGGVITYTVNGAQRVAVATGYVSPAFPTEIRRAKIAILGIEGETGSK